MSQKEIQYINASQDSAAERFGEAFYRSVRDKIEDFRTIIFLCIGSDRSTGDSLGPIAGHKLQLSLWDSADVKVYGTLAKPVHAKNICQVLENIRAARSNPFIIAVDACLGKFESVGFLTIGEGPVHPGAGLCKDLPAVGHIAVTGIVNVANGMDFAVLQNTRLHLVMLMADVIHEGILSGLKILRKRDSKIYENIV
ncbi:MAG: spore protease YyaC [Clostridiales bacterium]|nr:spore protease YyaC [Clostridiales bacterium]